jgi:hypothetical protein
MDNEDFPPDLVPLIHEGIAELLSRPGLDHHKRDFIKSPLTHREQLFIITTLLKELEDPKIPGGLIFLYGRILEFIKSKILYN